MHVLTIEFVKLLLVGLSTLYTFRVKPTLLTCWANHLPMMHSTLSWSLSCFESQKLGGNRKANPSFFTWQQHSHMLSMTAIWMRCILFVLFCEAAITHFLEISFFVLLTCVWGRGVLGMRSISSSMYLTGLRLVIRSTHTHYTQSESNIREMSESDPIAHSCVWNKSQTEIMNEFNLEHD